MDSKIIKKILSYAKENEILDFSITQKDGSHFLWGESEGLKHQLKLPARLTAELSSSYRRLLKIAPDNLVSGAYFKNGENAYYLSIIPDGDNEKIIINTVLKNKKLFKLSHLGLGQNEKKEILNFLKNKQGLIVVGASDNQGKTSTLYALLNNINREHKICYSLEKYQELELDNLSQIYAPDDKRLSALDKILKSDSDVVMIDDASEELLKESLAGAQSGRLMLVGLKSDNTALLAEKIKELTSKRNFPVLVISQKIIDRNCPHCLKSYLIDEFSEIVTKHWPQEKRYQPKNFYTSQGCIHCRYLGHQGQIAVFNVIRLQKEQVNFISLMASDVLQKAASGLVSISKLISDSKK